MAIYVGTGARTLQLISSTVSKDRVKRLIEDEFLPSIGDVKYLARPVSVEVDTSSQYFDGWVYPDGSSFSSADFPEAAAVFGKGGASFSVPDLRNFIKPAPAGQPIKTVDASACVPKHYHDVDTQVKYSCDHVLSSAFTIVQTKNPSCNSIARVTNDGEERSKPIQIKSKKIYKGYISGGGDYADYCPALHGGGDEIKSTDRQIAVDLNIPARVSFQVVNCASAGEEQLDAYPAHKLLQVMIYIGKKAS